ncbi:MAG: sulfotransferase [Cyclobacteriaceae bacterium]|nr:sulfotransferase [Cyclobacteriaceae bacterium]
MSYKILKYINYPIFIIGTGRSGTHWLAQTLASHPFIYANIEKQPMFGLSTYMALNPGFERTFYNRLIKCYNQNLIKCAPKLYLDKSHPNIWIAEKLKETFPSSLFIGIERNPYATIASMLRHKGVCSWFYKWNEFPVPNRFLGITKSLSNKYENMPLVAKCALRWLAHHNRMNELKQILNENIFILSYEVFAKNPENIVSNLQNFLKLEQPIPIPYVDEFSLNKWTKQLSCEDINIIDNILSYKF